MKKRFRSFAVTLVIVAVFLVIVVSDDVRSSGNDFFIQYADQCFANGSIDLTDNDGNPVSESEKAYFVSKLQIQCHRRRLLIKAMKMAVRIMMRELL